MSLRRAARSALRLAVSALLLPALASAYPLDGYENTSIMRLEVQRQVQLGKAQGRKRPPGELLPIEKVQLRLLNHPDLTLPPSDPKLTRDLKRLIGPDVSRYGVALLDLSDLGNIRYAEWNGDQRQNPGSVGKIMVALGIFQALADSYPDDIEARKQTLRNTIITADIFSVSDHHTVPKWNSDTRSLSRSPIHQGDKASLWTYFDWMMSPSSNSAASMLQKQLVLMKQYGKAYPPSEAEQKRFFDETPKKELSALFEAAIQGPVTRNGLDLDALRQGSFFTHQGKRQVPGTSSYATPRELMNFMLKMEQGKLVDAWSSLELKRLLYITERRIRYASSGVLRQSAVYFKSGSLYSCMEEEGFTCKKYHGNKRNYMNSIAIIESPAGQNRLHYMVSVLSNVLRKNSAVDHRDLARAVHAKLLRDHPAKKQAAGERPDSLTYGEGFIGYEAERKDLLIAAEIQEGLIALGYEIGDIDGVIGGKSRSAIRSFQKTQGMKVTGTASESLSQALKKVAQASGTARPD